MPVKSLVNLNTIIVTCSLIWIIPLLQANGLVHQNLSDEFVDTNQSTDSFDDSNLSSQLPSPFSQQSLSSLSNLYLSTTHQSPQFVYPELPEPQQLTTASSEPGIEDSQIAQPDFSSERLENIYNEPLEVPDDTNLATNPNVFQEETTLFENDEIAPTDMDNLTEISEDLETDPDKEIDNWVTENDIEMPEPLPTPVAIISANGEGSNPSIEEEFAEAFKRVGPKNKRRRKKQGRKRVRMRVRKVNRNSTENPIHPETQSQNIDYNTEFETTEQPSSPKPRRYRSTTPSPDPSPPTIPQTLSTGLSVVKNGPKPLIISDIHSGSTGINSVTTEPQLEKPSSGGFTEKISTYFITPSSRISTTEAPKVNNSEIEDSKPVESVVHIKSSPYRKDSWPNKFSNIQDNEQTSTSTRASHTLSISSKAGESSGSGYRNQNSLQTPTMQDRTYTVQNPDSVNEPSEYDRGNFLTPSPSYQSMEDQSHFHENFNGYGNSQKQNNAESNTPSISQQNVINQPEYGRFEDNTPFSTQGQGHEFPTGSHYDRTKDLFLNGNNFYKNNPFQSQNEANTQSNFNNYETSLSNNNQGELPVFDKNEYRNTQLPNYYGPSSQGPQEHSTNNPGAVSHQESFNDYGKQVHYDAADGFKSSQMDPTSGGIRGSPYPSGPSVTLRSTFGQNTPEENPSFHSNGPSGPMPLSQNVNPGIGDTNIINQIPSNHPAINSYIAHSPVENSFNTPDVSQHFTQNVNHPNALRDGQIVGTIESVPVYEVNNDIGLSQVNNVIDNSQGSHDIGPSQVNNEYGLNEEGQKFPVFIATSPGEPNRAPKFLPTSPISHKPPNFRHSNFLRNHIPYNGPLHPHPPRYIPIPHHRHPGPMYSPHSQNNPFNFFGPGSPPPDFRNNNPPYGNFPHPGLQNISPPPSESQAINEVQPNPHFPPYSHSMFQRPDYEPANPPLPPGHPLENHIEAYQGQILNNPNSGITEHELHHAHDPNSFKSSDSGPNIESASGDGQTTHNPVHPSQSINGESIHNDRPGFDIMSAYYDKPPPTVGYYPSSEYNKAPVHQVKDNSLQDVPFQYTSSDGGGLDGGPYLHNPGSEHRESSEDKRQHKPQIEDNENEKNKSSVFSETPYVLMFPQLVPEEAFIPPPPKMLTEEIPVVQASSLSSMTFTPEGKPALGPGLKTVQVHPRHQMYQVLAKAHYDKTMAKYIESKKKPHSPIYTPYGVLVPMGPTASASTNHETRSHHPTNRKNPHDKHLLNFLLGSNSPFGNYRLNKGTSRNGKFIKSLDFKANIEPALDLLSEKLAIKLGAVKHILSAPAKLKLHAYKKQYGSYSDHLPLTQPTPKEYGEKEASSDMFESFLAQSSDIKDLKSEKNATIVDPALKQQLKVILKERLKEILEESDNHESFDKAVSSRTGPMMGLPSIVVKTQVPPPNSYSKWTNYFSNSNQPPNTGGLIGTIKRLFSFGGSENDKSDGGFPTSSKTNLLSRNRSHPFEWYASFNQFNPFNSVGRMGAPQKSNRDHPTHMQGTSTWKPENKTKKQLEKWLDIILSKSSNSPSTNSKDLHPGSKISYPTDMTSRQGKSFKLKDNTALPSSISSIKVIPPKSKLTSILAKRLGEPDIDSGSSNNFFYTSWRPMVSAFRSAFNYSPLKASNNIKSKA